MVVAGEGGPACGCVRQQNITGYLCRMTIPQPIDWTATGGVRILDQTLLPGEERYLDLDTVDAVAEAIRTLRVRGAPLIGIAAAMGVTLAARGRTASLEAVCAASRTLGATRPTAVNLHWALGRM